MIKDDWLVLIETKINRPILTDFVSFQNRLRYLFIIFLFATLPDNRTLKTKNTISHLSSVIRILYELFLFIISSLKPYRNIIYVGRQPIINILRC